MQNVDILLASYNGEKYIGEQIDSIMRQTHELLHLYIRDDFSTDKTRAIIHEKVLQYPGKVTFVNSDDRLGVIGNFSNLMAHSHAKYIMFSDQDDLWLPEKVSKSLGNMLKLEQEYGTDLPLLVHTDVKVVDSNLNAIDASFYRYSQLKPRLNHTLNRLLMQNVVIGCTMLINKPLRELAYPVPNQVVMHDWWIALVAALFGKISVLEEPTMLYRQHSHNQVGVASLSARLKRILTKPIGQIQKVSENQEKQKKQASALLECYSAKMSVQQRTIVEQYCKLAHAPLIQQYKIIFKNGFYKNGFLRNCGMAVMLALKSMR